MNMRRPDIDWLRIGATYLLFLFHAGKVFDPAPFFHIRNDELSFAILSFGAGRVMLSAGGRASDAVRRDVDLYVQTDRVEALYDALKDRVEVVEPVHDTFYGMREFIVRDPNRFWITFGQAVRPASPPGP